MKVLSIVAVALASTAVTANANTITYSLAGSENFNFGGAGASSTISGTVEVDSATGQITSAAVSETSSLDVFSRQFGQPDQTASGSAFFTTGASFLFPGGSDNNGTWEFNFAFNNFILISIPNPNPDGVSWTPFTTATFDGSVDIQCSLSQPACDGSLYAPISGSISETTPLPSALPLFAGGLGALGLLGWRRKRKSVAASCSSRQTGGCRVMWCAVRVAALAAILGFSVGAAPTSAHANSITLAPILSGSSEFTFSITPTTVPGGFNDVIEDEINLTGPLSLVSWRDTVTIEQYDQSMNLLGSVGNTFGIEFEPDGAAIPVGNEIGEANVFPTAAIIEVQNQYGCGLADCTTGGNITIFTDSSPIALLPLPAALPLFAAGLGAFGLLGWRRKRKPFAIAA